LLHGPFLWLYIKHLTNENMKLRRIHMLHFAPFIFYSVFHYFNFLSLPSDEKILLTNQLFATRIAPKIGTLIIGLSTVGYNIIVLFMLKTHRKNIRNKFSNIENIELNWLRTFVVASLVIFSINVLLFILNNHMQFTEDHKLSQVAYSFSAVYVFYIGYFGIRQGQIFVDNPGKTVEKSHERQLQKETVNIEKKDYSHIISKLTIFMEIEQPFLDPELSLAKLSDLLQIKPEILSEVLNASLNQNFFEYINKYRVEEFKIQCLKQDKKHLSVIGIAYDCGFNSKAAFYRAFNKFEGMSPTTYISKVS
jgi:YesN/AraC family two-component response regulator